MIQSVSFTIPGRIRGKGRPRFRAMSAKGRTFVQTYTDAKTESGEAVVRHFASEAMKGRPPMDGPVSIQIEIVMHHPKSWSKKKRAGTKFPTCKPDADNQLKLVGDACNGILWHDDSQISEVSLTRLYADNEGERVQNRARSLT